MSPVTSIFGLDILSPYNPASISATIVHSLHSSQGVFLFFIFILTFYFDITLHSQKSCKNKFKNSSIPFTQIPQMLTYF